MAIDRCDITGLLLAGGEGRRMGGADKGLQLHRGRPLAAHVLERLAPQVAGVAISANRNLADYARFGWPVWPDLEQGFPGPLAGWLSGMRHAPTPWLASAPCDVPNLPLDLVQRLADAAGAAGAPLAIARTAEREQPVFAMLHRSLADDLQDYLGTGQRKVLGWTARHPCIQVLFDDAAAFRNLNTPQDLDPPPT